MGLSTAVSAGPGRLPSATAAEAWIALRLQWSAAVLPGFLLLCYVAAVAAIRALQRRYSA
ncbi:hypothetical protein H4S01_006564, partial [Coemansia sp. RSA 2610]